jgi:dipeptidyl-peptidase 4
MRLMKRSFFTLLLAAFATVLFAQDKLLTLEDALVKNRSTLAPQSLRQLQFMYNTEDYVYLGKAAGKDAYMLGNFSAPREQVLVSLEKLNTVLKAAGMDTVTALPVIQFNQSPEWIMNIKGNKLALDPPTGKIRTLIPAALAGKENVTESRAGYIAYLDNFNLFISDGKNTEQVTTDGSADIVYASSVHRDEFGISKGIFWSNGGKHLAFYRMDQSMVTDYPIINWNERPARNENTKYPMAGDKSHHVTVGICNAVTGARVYVNTGAPAEQYLTNIAWTPDDRYLLIAVLNRQQDHLKLNMYDATTGQWVKTLFEEKDEKYVEPLQPPLFVKNKPGQFIWQSNRDGWNHLYLYDMNGNLLKQLTKGSWEVLEVKGFDAKGENLFYVATTESPLTRDLYLVNLKTGLSRGITILQGVHNTQVSTSGKYVLDNLSYQYETPREVHLIDAKTTKLRSIFRAPNPLAGYALGEMRIFSIPGEGGVPLYCRLYKPVNFDSTRKYPVIAYWYGGSHVQTIGNNWNGNASDYWFQYMAERGYLVFSIDPRGSDNRGKAFEQAMFRNVGQVQAEDMMRGVNYLKTLPYADTDRMGLFGWSFGGFNTINFMLRYPGVFKAGVAGGPVTDWKYYEIMYTERYMDTPQENPDGYANTDLSGSVGKLKGKLLLIHGLQDNVVVQQHSVNFVKAAVDKGMQVDYMIYPGHEHNVTGKDRVHLYQKVSDYLMQHVK